MCPLSLRATSDALFPRRIGAPNLLIDLLDEGLVLLAFLPFVMMLLLTWRLAVAIRRYLRFRHALATAIAVQVIFVLVAAQVCVLLTGY